MMIRPQRGLIAAAQRRATSVASIPAPVGGWNARDSLANMDEADAVVLDNMFPSTSNVVLRGGYAVHATGLPDQVETLMDYSGAATEKLFAISGTAVYDVTSAGAVGAAVKSGLTNARWQYTNISTTGGNYLYAANGVDAPLCFDGTTWTSVTAVSTPAITGVTTTLLDGVILHKNRLWFYEKNTLKAWYLPTASIGGAAQLLDLRSVAAHGGYLVAMGTWTVDAGYGMDDNLVFVTSEGEIIIYRGTDPSSAATWALTGVWQLGNPLGKRCLAKYGGDLVYVSYFGVLPLTQALQSDRLNPKIAFSDKIQGAFAAAATAYGATFGWQPVVDNKNNALYVNVPVSVGGQHQYVMNNITKAWCRFTGWAANVFEIFNNEAYFGGDGVVCTAWDSSYTDNDANITSNALQAFNYLGKRGVQKFFTRARPTLFSNGSPGLFLGVNTDFNTASVVAALSPSVSTGAVWDSAVWDSAVWGDGLTVKNDWQGITGLGYCAAINLITASQGMQIEWASTDIDYQLGWPGI